MRRPNKQVKFGWKNSQPFLKNCYKSSGGDFFDSHLHVCKFYLTLYMTLIAFCNVWFSRTNIEHIDGLTKLWSGATAHCQRL